MRDYLSANMRPVSSSDLDEVLGPVKPAFDQWWTDKDERTLQKRWAKWSEKKEIEKLEAPLNSTERGVFDAIQGMWKICLRVLRCSPFAVQEAEDYYC